MRKLIRFTEAHWFTIVVGIAAVLILFAYAPSAAGLGEILPYGAYQPGHM